MEQPTSSSNECNTALSNETIELNQPVLSLSPKNSVFSAASSLNGANSPKSLKRRRSISKEMRWNFWSSNSEEQWFYTEDAYKQAWLENSNVTCKLGCGQINGASLSNLSKHLEVKQHRAALTENSNSITKFIQPVGNRNDLQAFLLMAAIPYVVPSNIGVLFNPQGNIGRIVSKLSAKPSDPMPEGGSVSRAMIRAAELLQAEIKCLLDGRSMSVIIDEANTRFDGRQRALAITVCCSAIGKPIIVKLISSIDDYMLNEIPQIEGQQLRPSSVAAAAIKKTLKDVGVNYETQLTCIVGDNAAFNDAVAEEVGVPRLRCIPHCLSLIYAELTKRFKLFTTVTSGLAALIKSGGGMARSKALKAAGITISRCHPVATRWGQTLAMAQYLIEPQTQIESKLPLDIIREVISKDSSFAIDSVNADDESEVISAVPGNIRRKSPLKKLLQQVRDAFEVDLKEGEIQTRNAEVELRTVCFLAGDVQEVIKIASADSNNLADEFDSFLIYIKNRLDSAVLPQFQKLIIESSLKLAPSLLQNLYIDQYSAIIIQSAKDALVKWNEYIPNAVHALHHRLMYDPKRKPPPLPEIEPGQQFDVKKIAHFLGAMPENITMDVVTDFNIYVKKWDNISEEIKNLGIGKFWTHPEVLKMFNYRRNLPKIALWYSDRPTSSVAVERQFGLLRTMESPIRMHKTFESVETELMLKANRWIVDEIVSRAAK